MSVNIDRVDDNILNLVISPGINIGGKNIVSYNVYDSMAAATNPVTIVGAAFLRGESNAKKAFLCYDDDVNTYGPVCQAKIKRIQVRNHRTLWFHQNTV